MMKIINGQISQDCESMWIGHIQDQGLLVNTTYGVLKRWGRMILWLQNNHPIHEGMDKTSASLHESSKWDSQQFKKMHKPANIGDGLYHP